MSQESDLALALAFQRQSVELTAESVEAIDEGWVFRSPSLPEVWSHNQVWVNRPVSPAAASELCRRHLEGAQFWQIELEGEAAARELVEPLRAEGWEIDVEIHMR